MFYSALNDSVIIFLSRSDYLQKANVDILMSLVLIEVDVKGISRHFLSSASSGSRRRLPINDIYRIADTTGFL